MSAIDQFVRTVEQQAKSLAEKLFKQFVRDAVSDVHNFLDQSRIDLNRWREELAHHQLDKDEFRSLVRGQLDVAEMRALKQAGLAQVKIDTFTSGLLDIVVNAALAMVP
jgi:hypothetical protein